MMGKEMSSLTVRDLCKTYIINKRQNHVLKNINFEMQEGEMVAVMGPSGSGKSTLLLPAYQSKKNKGKRQQVDEHAKKLMQKMGISEIAENGVNEVSGGQLQRACICRSLINYPRMIFADEPTGALNQQNSREVMRELVRINREGTTIMLVTHDMRVAAKSDRVLYIEDGTIKGEYTFGKFASEEETREREKQLSGWLMEMGW